MDAKKIIAAILDLEEVVNKAEELQAIAALQYDSFVEGRCLSEDSSVYNFTAVKDGNNLKIATAGSTFSGKKWVTMIIFGTA